MSKIAENLIEKKLNELQNELDGVHDKIIDHGNEIKRLQSKKKDINQEIDELVNFRLGIPKDEPLELPSLFSK